MGRKKKTSTEVKVVTGERISLLMERLGLSQEKFASIIGEDFQQRYVSRIKRGERSLLPDERGAILKFLLDPVSWCNRVGIPNVDSLPISRYPWGCLLGTARDECLSELVEGLTDPSLPKREWVRLLERCAAPTIRNAFCQSELLSLPKEKLRAEIDDEVRFLAEKDVKTFGLEFVSNLLAGTLTETEIVQRSQELDDRDVEIAKVAICKTLETALSDCSDRQILRFFSLLEVEPKKHASTDQLRDGLIACLMAAHLEDRETSEPTVLRVFRFLGFLLEISNDLTKPSVLTDAFASQFRRARTEIESHNLAFEKWVQDSDAKEENLRRQIETWKPVFRQVASSSNDLEA